MKSKKRKILYWSFYWKGGEGEETVILINQSRVHWRDGRPKAPLFSDLFTNVEERVFPLECVTT